MSIRIVTDSAADLEAAEFARYGIELLPLTLNVDQRSFAATETFNKADFFRMLEVAEVFPTTSQPTPAQFETLFEDARQKGDELIFISLAGVLSGTNQSANAIRGLGDYDNVYIIDSKTVTMAQKLLVVRAAELRDQGKSAPEIVRALEALRSRVKVYAGLDTLEYLRRGGRLGRAAAGIGTLARIKPVVTVSGEGAVQVAAKGIGKARAMKELCALVEKSPPDPSFPIYGLYAGNDENLQELLPKLAALGIEVPADHQFCIGPIIGAHVGPGAYGLAYVAKG
jgi:DegV family protein with EDD domain